MAGLCSVLTDGGDIQTLACASISVFQSTELVLKSGLEGYCMAYRFNYAFQLLYRFLYETGEPEVLSASALFVTYRSHMFNLSAPELFF